MTIIVGGIEVPLWPLLLTCTVLCLYWYIRNALLYWKKRNIPSVPVWKFFRDSTSKPLHQCELEYHKKYGKIIGYIECLWPTISIADPELLNLILIKDFDAFTNRRKMTSGSYLLDNILGFLEDDEWKALRSITTLALTPAKLKRMVKPFKIAANIHADDLRELSKDSKPISLRKIFGLFLLDASVLTVFGYKVDHKSSWSTYCVELALRFFDKDIYLPLLLLMFKFPYTAGLFNRIAFGDGVLGFFHEFSKCIIKHRNSLELKPDDLLQAMISAPAEKRNVKENNDDHKNNNDHTATANNSQKTFVPRYSMDFVASQCISLILALIDTSTDTLSHAAYEMARHPDFQEMLIHEVDEMYEEAEGEIDYEDIKKLKFMDRFLSEVLRLHPISSRIERVASVDYKLGETGIVIPKGMVVIIPYAVLHKDPEYFPDPDKFDPDRFLKENQATHVSGTYMPFGNGRRGCPGKAYAWIEIKIYLAAVLRRVRFRMSPETKVPLECYRSFMMASKEVVLLVEERMDVS